MQLTNLNFYIDFEDLEPEEVFDIFSNAEDINCSDECGDSPLLYACKSMDVNLVEFLLSKDANPNYLNDAGESPLHTVIDKVEESESSALSIAQLLINNGSDIELRAHMNKTPFLRACSRNSKQMIQLLVDSGCNFQAVVEDQGEAMNCLTFADIFKLDKSIKEYLEDLMESIGSGS